MEQKELLCRASKRNQLDRFEDFRIVLVTNAEESCSHSDSNLVWNAEVPMVNSASKHHPVEMIVGGGRFSQFTLLDRVCSAYRAAAVSQMIRKTDFWSPVT